MQKWPGGQAAWQKILKGSEEEMRQREGKRRGEGEGRPAERRGGQGPFLCFSFYLISAPPSGLRGLPPPWSSFSGSSYSDICDALTCVPTRLVAPWGQVVWVTMVSLVSSVLFYFMSHVTWFIITLGRHVDLQGKEWAYRYIIKTRGSGERLDSFGLELCSTPRKSSVFLSGGCLFDAVCVCVLKKTKTKKPHYVRTSLVVQWLRLHLSMEGVQVQSPLEN